MIWHGATNADEKTRPNGRAADGTREGAEMAGGRGKVEAIIRLVGEDKISKIINDVEAGIKNVGEETRKSGTRTKDMASNWAIVATGINQSHEIAMKLFGGLEKAFDLAKQGAASLAIGASFKKAIPDADRFLQKLREATAFTIDDTSLQRIGRAAVSSGMEVGKVAEFAELATKASQSLGISATQAFESLTSVSVKLTGEGLESLKVRMDLGKILAEEERKLGLVGLGLDENQKRTALVNAAAEQMRQIYGDIELNENLSTQLQQVQTQMDNWWTTFQERFAEGIFEISRAVRNTAAEEIQEQQRALYQAALQYEAGLTSEKEFRRTAAELRDLSDAHREVVSAQINHMTQTGTLSSYLSQQAGTWRAFSDNMMAAQGFGSTIAAQNAAIDKAAQAYAKLSKHGSKTAEVLKTMQDTLDDGQTVSEKVAAQKEQEESAQQMRNNFLLDGINARMVAEQGYNMTVLKSVQDQQRAAETATFAAMAQARAAASLGDVTRATDLASKAFTSSTQAGSNFIGKYKSGTVALRKFRDEMIKTAQAQLVLAQAELKTATESFTAALTGQGYVSPFMGATLGEDAAAMREAQGQVDRLAASLKTLRGEEAKDPRKPRGGRRKDPAAEAAKARAKEAQALKQVLAYREELHRQERQAQIDVANAAIEKQTADLADLSAGEKLIAQKAALAEAEEILARAVAKAQRERRAAGDVQPELLALTKEEQILAKLRADIKATTTEIGEMQQEISDMVRNSARQSFSEAVGFANQFGNDYAAAFGNSLQIIQTEVDKFEAMQKALAAATGSTAGAWKKSAPSIISASGAITGAFIKDARKRALVLGGFEAASAIASLAIPDFRAAAMHGLAATMYFAVAGGTKSGSGGGGGGRASGSYTPAVMTPQKAKTGEGGGQAITLNFSGTIVGTDETAARQLASMIRRELRWSTAEPTAVS